MSDGDGKVVALPVRPKSKRLVEIARCSGGCSHPRVIVDPDLAELRCAQCKEKLNPITYLVCVADQFVRWDYQLDEIKRHRAELERRQQCRCLKCGEMTPVRAVGRRELARIRAAARPTSINGDPA